MGLTTLSLNRDKIAHTLLGEVFSYEEFFYFYDIFKNLFKGVGLATLSLINYNMARGLLGRSCFKYLNIIKNYPSALKKLRKFQKLIFLFVTIFFERKLSYLILRSRKFDNLVTSFFFKFSISKCQTSMRDYFRT